LGVYDDSIVTIDVEDADLDERSVCCWPDQHGQIIVHEHPPHSVANGVAYVCVGDAVLSRWLTDPHQDNIACLAGEVAGAWSRRITEEHRLAYQVLGGDLVLQARCHYGK
jgi:hypothetical protein